jgi:hypothetical protein
MSSTTSFINWWYSISDDLLFFIVTSGLAYCLYREIVEVYFLSNKEENPKKVKRALTHRQLRKRYRSILTSPIYFSSNVRKMEHFDLLSLNHYIPMNSLLASADYEITENNINLEVKPDVPRPKSMSIVTPIPTPEQQSMKEMFDMCSKITFPFMQGCEPDCPAALSLASKYPELNRADIVRYLVARKGSQKAADEMIEKCLNWRKLSFPLKKADVAAAFQTQCFFPYGQAKDGSPLVFMRGGLYDANVATPLQYVLAAAYTIDYSLRQYPDQVNVTVIVHTVNIPGGPNQSADTNFIKLFSQVRGFLSAFSPVFSLCLSVSS